MRERILNYDAKITGLLKNPPGDCDWNKILDDLLIQISFFQHERLIHLIVTITFALLEIISVFMSVLLNNPGCIILSIVILCLLIPYIRHYYILENYVQRFYTYYDEIRLKI